MSTHNIMIIKSIYNLYLQKMYLVDHNCSSYKIIVDKIIKKVQKWKIVFTLFSIDMSC